MPPPFPGSRDMPEWTGCPVALSPRPQQRYRYRRRRHHRDTARGNLAEHRGGLVPQILFLSCFVSRANAPFPTALPTTPPPWGIASGAAGAADGGGLGEPGGGPRRGTAPRDGGGRRRCPRSLCQASSPPFRALVDNRRRLTIPRQTCVLVSAVAATALARSLPESGQPPPAARFWTSFAPHLLGRGPGNPSPKIMVPGHFFSDRNLDPPGWPTIRIPFLG